MTQIPRDRLRQALQASDVRRTPASADEPKADALVQRLRAAAGNRQLVVPVAAPPPPVLIAPAPRVEKVRLQMTCGETGRPFVAIAERRGDGLVLVGYEPAPTGRGSATAAERLSGAYRIDKMSGWACPHCRSGENTWSCGCTERPDSLHCGGRRGRLRYCACGRLEERDLVEVETIAVRGQSIAATARTGSPASPGGGRGVPALLPKR